MIKRSQSLLKFKINGQIYLYKNISTLNVKDLLTYLGFNKNVIVVDHNGFILERKSWNQTLLQNNDSLEILSIAGGG